MRNNQSGKWQSFRFIKFSSRIFPFTADMIRVTLCMCVCVRKAVLGSLARRLSFWRFFLKIDRIATDDKIVIFSEAGSMISRLGIP